VNRARRDALLYTAGAIAGLLLVVFAFIVAVNLGWISP
jgi:hypothetical protein